MHLTDEQLDRWADNRIVKIVGNIIGITVLVLVCFLDDKEARQRARAIEG